ncbi:MAG: hypothetical protein ACRC7C_19825 [Beijerinckiaceae bacterium]
MNTTTLERTESAPRLQAFEQVDKANEDALWERREAYTAHRNKVCAAIQAMPRDMVDADYIGQVLSTLSCKAAEALLNEIADELCVIACEVTP